MRVLNALLRSFLGQTRRLVKGSDSSILNGYTQAAPNPQLSLDVFRGEWSSRLPEPLAHLRAGPIETFDDHRIHWFVNQIGGVRGRSVYECGPLEAGHTYMMEKYGASGVVAVEANQRAFLKCLVVKELLELQKVRFLHGDFVQHLRETDTPFDICLVSGVLYHMLDPVELIALIAKHCRGHCFIWTHYYDEKIITSSRRLARQFKGVKPSEHDGFAHTLYRREYQGALNWSGFCGGGSTLSYWMSREDILNALAHFGFEVVGIDFDQPNHQHGPAFAITAKRR